MVRFCFRWTSFHVVIFILHIWSGKSSEICRQFGDSWKRSNAPGALCFTYHDKKSSWWDARKTCERQGKILVKITNKTVDEFLGLKFLQGENPNIWIDGIDRGNGAWRWADGRSMKYTNFGTFSWTTDQFLNFFTRINLCALKDFYSWVKKSCNYLASFVCQSTKGVYGKVTLVSDKSKEETTPSTTFRIEKLTTTTDHVNPGEDTTVTDDRTINDKRSINGINNPKLALPGMATTDTSLSDCVRICATNITCGLVNFCVKGGHCKLYNNYDFTDSAQVTSQVGCLVYMNTRFDIGD